MTSFTAWDIPFEGRLEYAVALDINPGERLCLFENLPLVRAILSWDDPPPPNTPNFPPVWGTVKEARIQIDAWKFPDLDTIFTAGKVKLPASLLSLIDVKHPVPLKQAAPLTPTQLFERYKKKDVPPHRFLQKHLAAYLTSPVAIKTGGSPFAIADTTIDWESIFDKYLATDGDTSYEELTCIGL